MTPSPAAPPVDTEAGCETPEDEAEIRQRVDIAIALANPRRRRNPPLLRHCDSDTDFTILGSFLRRNHSSRDIFYAIVWSIVMVTVISPGLEYGRAAAIWHPRTQFAASGQDVQ